MIENLPDFAVLRKLAEALWRQDLNKCGAAIMIGAGFSRCASRHVDGSKKLPLWNDLCEKLVRELNPHQREREFTDPLRLAEEYRAYFGQAALSQLIRAEINDLSWQPGVLHRDLLTLPWAEVMTTNWDSLLERAAQGVHRPIYTLVNKQSELASARSPRIVKLHGSVDVTDQLIFAQEDYRKYPQNFAAFVNFARQVFIENELCLLGFSGDDPNFLQWAGWVRDNLADQARRIYLVGALNLSASQKKFLESINIAPLDLYEAVKHIDDPDLRHFQATTLFLRALLEAKPKPLYKWQPKSMLRQNATADDFSRKFNDHPYAASLLNSQLEMLRIERETYPGWVVCPPDLISSIQSQICDPYPTAKNVASLDAHSKAKLLYEMAWRDSITFAPLQEWEVAEHEKVADLSIKCVLSRRQQMEIGLLLLTNSRRRMDREKFSKWAKNLDAHALHLPDCVAEVSYQRALFARDQLDYQSLEKLVTKIAGEDPMWKVRKASLLTDLGRFDEASNLVSEAHKALLENSRQDPASIKIQSRLAWVEWISRHVEFSRSFGFNDELPNEYKILRCDPWDQISHLQTLAAKKREDYFKSLETIEPLFEKGHYVDHSRDLKFNAENPVLFHLLGISDQVGLPLWWDHMNLLGGVAESLLPVEKFSLQDFVFAIRCSSSDSSEAIKHCFSRIALANAEGSEIAQLSGFVKQAVAYWRKQALSGSLEQKRKAIDRIRVLAEVLARLAIRQTPEDAITTFKLALEMGQDSALQHHWLHEVLGHLMQYSLQSIPSSQKSQLLLDALSFPVFNETTEKNGPEWRWPNPVVKPPSERLGDLNLDARISALINLVSKKSASRAAILLRLFPLLQVGFLRADECDKLAHALWGRNPDYQSVPHTDLLAHALVELPAPDREKANQLMRKILFGSTDASFITTETLSAISGAVLNKSNRLLPTDEQAIRYFKFLTDWRPAQTTDTPLPFRHSETEALIEDVGEALAVIVPALPFEEITEQRFSEIYSFYKEVNSLSSIVAFPYFIRVSDSVAELVRNSIRKGMQGRTAKEVRAACLALIEWKTLASAKKVAEPPDSLVSKLIYLIEAGRTVGLPSLLFTAGELLKKGWLSAADTRSLADSLPDLFKDADYVGIRKNGPEGVTASMIRETCTKLARFLCERESSPALLEMINLARNDNLPEVRFSATEPLEILQS
jgi:hypothetical protein